MSRQRALANNPLSAASLAQSVELTSELRSLVGKPARAQTDDWACMTGRKRWFVGPAEILETAGGLTIRIDSSDPSEQLALLEEILAFRKTSS